MSKLPDSIVPTLAQRICPGCGATVEPAAAACVQCGVRLPAARLSLPARSTAPWSEQRLPLMAILFFGFGPFALPWLWRSGAFGRGAKVALSLAVSVYFALLCWACWWAIGFLWRAVRQLG